KTRIEPADFEAFRRFYEDVSKHYRAWLALRPTTDLADAKLLEEALKQKPGDKTAALVLARLYLQHGQRGEARRVLETARHQHSNDAMLWDLTIQTAEGLKDQETAYQEMVQRFPQEPKYGVALGETRINLGDFAGARQVLEPMVSKGPEVWRGLAH